MARKSLAFKVVILIVAVLLPLNLLLFVSTGRLINHARKQVQLNLQNTGDVYMNTLDIQMRETDYYLYDMYMSDLDMQSIRNSSDELEYENACFRVQQKLLKKIEVEQVCDAYFFYQESKERYLFGASPTLPRIQMRETLEEVGNEPRKWSLYMMDGTPYAVRVVRAADMCYGAMMNLETVRKEILQSLNYSSVQVAFYQQKETVNREGLIESEALSVRGTTALQISVSEHEVYENLSFMERTMWVISILSLLLIPLMFWILHRLIIQPLNILNLAHQELEQGNELYRIKMKSSTREMGEAFESFNHMADNIHSLKLTNMEKELARNQLELMNMQLQIRPHFLLNTFNLMFNLVSEGKMEEIKKLIMYLADYFRHIFRNGKELELLQKELHLIERYMDAARIRYPGMLSIAYQIDPELSLVRVPPLLIHNFIENVVKHALVKGRTIHIVLAGEYENGMVTFKISDDGKGMSQKDADDINKERYLERGETLHVGLKNSLLRLRHFYGEEASLTVESELDVGTEFVISFPYNLEEI